MKKLTAFLLVLSLLAGIAVSAGAAGAVTLDSPGTYTAEEETLYHWTVPENGNLTFTVHSEDDWKYEVVFTGKVWYATSEQEDSARSFSTWIEGGTTLSMIVGSLSGSGDVEFTFSFTPDGTGSGGLITECTHHISGDGSLASPYVYDSVKHMMADWTRHKVKNSMLCTVYISAPLGGKTLNITAEDTVTGSDVYATLWCNLPYQSASGETVVESVFLTGFEAPTSYTFDTDAFYALPPTYGDNTLAAEPWTDGSMVTFSITGGPMSEGTFMAVDLTVESPAGGGSVSTGGNCGENVKWSLSDGVLTIFGSGPMDDYARPWHEHRDSIHTIIIKDGVTSIGARAFSDYANVTSISIADSITAIGAEAFRYCENLPSIPIPDSVTTIGNEAFAYCGTLETVVIPAGVTHIGSNAFTCCYRLGGIWVDPRNQVYSECMGVLMDKNQTTLITCPGYLSSCYIPETVTKIESFAFDGCSRLTEVTIPNSVTDIGSWAFAYCPLTEITIPGSVKRIGNGAFRYTDLVSVTFRDGATGIGSQTFEGCDRLKKIVFEGSAPEADDEIFVGVNATAYYPENDPTWTEEVMSWMGQRAYITWKFLGSESDEPIPPDDGAIDSGTCGENVFWSLSQDGTLTVYGTGPMYNFLHPWSPYSDSITSIVIEDGITAVGDQAFADCYQVHSVSIAESVTYIGEQAFRYCENLPEITLPANLTYIGSSAFACCSRLVTVFVPASVTYLDPSAFSLCYSLDGIWVDDGNPNYSSDDMGVLFNKDQTVLYTAPGTLTGYAIPDTVTAIASFAFDGCFSLIEVTIPDSVTDIGSWAFADCPFTELIIPGSVKRIGNGAFRYSDLTSVTFRDGVTGIGSQAFEYCEQLNTITFEGAAPQADNEIFLGVNATAYYPANDASWTEEIMSWMGEQAYITWIPLDTGSGDGILAEGSCGDHLTWVLTDDGVLTISGTGPMYDYEGGPLGNIPWLDYTFEIRQAIIENGVTTVGANAFSCCGMMTQVSLPDTLVSIGEQAFYSTALTSIHIPRNVTEIGINAFCSSIIQYNVDPENPCFRSGQRDALYDKQTNALLRWPNSPSHNIYDIPEGVHAIGPYAFNGCYYLTEVHLGDDVKTVESNAFNGCSPTTVTFGAGEIVLEDYAFAYCGIGLLELPDNVVSLGEHVFYICSNLQQITIGRGITEIPAGAFSGCHQLHRVRLPDTVTSIGENAFECCFALYGIGIPDSVTSIGREAFGSSGLSEIHLPDSVTSIGRYAFTSCTSLWEVSIGSGVKELPQDCFSYCEALQSVLLSEGLETVGHSAFQGSGIIGITLPDSVTAIDASAFSQCPNLSYVSLGGNLKTIGNGAFSDCPSLTSIRIPEGVTSIGSSAFQETGLREMVFPDSLEVISSWILDDCPHLERIIFGRNVRKIDTNVFAHSDLLREIIFTGNAPAEIGRWAFVGNPFTAYYPGGNPTWTSEMLQNYGSPMTWVPMYEVLEGDDTQWTPDTEEPVVVRVDSPLEKFRELRINGEVVPNSCYTLTEGSTVVTLLPEYLATLSAGEYRIELLFTDSKALSEFTVLAPRVAGDVDGNGVADAADAYAIVMYYKEALMLTEDQLALADVNGDGRVDLADAYAILNYR